MAKHVTVIITNCSYAFKINFTSQCTLPLRFSSTPVSHTGVSKSSTVVDIGCPD